jgi:alpha-L-fucosidase
MLPRPSQAFPVAWRLALLTIGCCLSMLPTSARAQQLTAPSSEQVVKVACVGDSITHGTGLMRSEGTTYPDMLGHQLGDGFEVRNFGVSGATMLRAGNKPWLKTKLAEPALQWKAEVVVIQLGTNDSKLSNWGEHGKSFAEDSLHLIDQFRQSNPNARIVLCTPLPSWKEGDSINGQRIADEIVPVVRQVAAQQGLELIDLQTRFQDNRGWFQDGVHPNPHGALAVARRIAETVGAEMDWKFSMRNMLALHSMVQRRGDFHGFEMLEFKWAGAACKIVFPRVVAAGRPWVWRARFWGHEPQFDRAMLERGWHVVYCDVAGLLGGPEAIKRWGSFYELLHKSGLSATPFLEGMSRGGLPIYQWAKQFPERVCGIYADNPVVDPQSWSGSRDHAHTRGATFGLHSEEARQAWQRMASAGIPLLHVVGEADSVVPVEANTNVLERLYLRAGGSIKVIRKPGLDHHPHSLPNPQPIVDFALHAAGLRVNPCVVAQPSVEWRGNPAGWGGGTWGKQHRAINQLGKDHPDQRLVFLGDSITQSWTGAAERLGNAEGSRIFDQFYGKRRAASFGISGDRTEHLLWRIQNGNFDSIRPEAIVLMIGVNNINAGDDGHQVADGIRAVVSELRERLPQTEIVLLGCFPTSDAGSWRRAQANIVHEKIAGLGNREMIHYLDLRRLFENADGSLNSTTMRSDGVHITQTGYRAWAEAMEPTIREVLGEELEQEEQPKWLKQAARIAPSARQLAWQDLELTCFIHFGINTFTDREWGTGTESPSDFNPTALDAEQWVLAAKAAGMKLVLLTAKHHDGFCLWPSRYTPHSVARSPWKDGKGDVVGDLAAACRKHGLKIGVYLSPADLNAIERKVYGDGSTPVECGVPTHAPRFQYSLDTYNLYFMNQLYELLSDYGQIDEVWFDGANPKPGTGQTYDREAWYEMIRILQPQATIAIDGPDVRWIGNEGGHARAGGEWSVVPMKAPEKKNQIRVKMVAGATQQDLGSRQALKVALDQGAVLRWYPAEMDTSMRGGWFYHAHEDGHAKGSVERLMHLFDTSYGGNSVLLLNLSPDRRGLIQEDDARRLAEFGALVQQSFSRNLATGAQAMDLDGSSDPKRSVTAGSAENAMHQASAAVDGDAKTWWQPLAGQNRASLEIDLGKIQKANLLELREAISEGQRIEKYFVEGWTGSGWTWMCEGNAVGNRALRRFAEIEVSRLRIHITSSRLHPTLAEVGLYLAPVLLNKPAIEKLPSGKIRIRGQAGVEIRYTVDGTEPGPQSLLYTSPFELSTPQIRARCMVREQPSRMGTIASATFDLRKAKWRIHDVSSEQADSNEGAKMAIDGNVKTLWHSQWRPTSPTYPHAITIDFGERLDVSGFVYTPRSDANRNGTILSYRVELSSDGNTWTNAAEADFQNMVNNPTERRVMFRQHHLARYLRLTALSEITGQAWASAAELDVTSD